MSGRYVGHIIRYDKCAICGNCWKTGKLLHPEKIVTSIIKWNTVVKFHIECCKEMLRAQREGV